jgi:hypothetical protein
VLFASGIWQRPTSKKQAKRESAPGESAARTMEPERVVNGNAGGMEMVFNRHRDASVDALQQVST